jgi:CRP-like cAMP-binding protein
MPMSFQELTHCMHGYVLQVNFEPREVVVNQGDVSDCMYVLKSGQVSAPDLTSCRLGASVDR